MPWVSRRLEVWGLTVHRRLYQALLSNNFDPFTKQLGATASGSYAAHGLHNVAAEFHSEIDEQLKQATD